MRSAVFFNRLGNKPFSFTIFLLPVIEKVKIDLATYFCPKLLSYFKFKGWHLLLFLWENFGQVLQKMYIRRRKNSELLDFFGSIPSLFQNTSDSWYESDIFPWFLLLFDWFLIATGRHCNDVLLSWSWYLNCYKRKNTLNAVDGTAGTRRNSFSVILPNNRNNTVLVFPHTLLKRM